MRPTDFCRVNLYKILIFCITIRARNWWGGIFLCVVSSFTGTYGIETVSNRWLLPKTSDGKRRQVKKDIFNRCRDERKKPSVWMHYTNWA